MKTKTSQSLPLEEKPMLQAIKDGLSGRMTWQFLNA